MDLACLVNDHVWARPQWPEQYRVGYFLFICQTCKEKAFIRTGDGCPVLIKGRWVGSNMLGQMGQCPHRGVGHPEFDGEIPEE